MRTTSSQSAVMGLTSHRRRGRHVSSRLQGKEGEVQPVGAESKDQVKAEDTSRRE